MRHHSQTLASMICPAHQSCLCDRHGRTKIATNKLCRLATVLPYTAAHEVSAARAQNHAEAIPWSVNTSVALHHTRRRAYASLQAQVPSVTGWRSLLIGRLACLPSRTRANCEQLGHFLTTAQLVATDVSIPIALMSEGEVWYAGWETLEVQRLRFFVQAGMHEEGRSWFRLLLTTQQPGKPRAAREHPDVSLAPVARVSPLPGRV
jgi:hypothetical protein